LIIAERFDFSTILPEYLIKGCFLTRREDA